MKTKISNRFVKDVKKIKDKRILAKIQQILLQAETIEELSELENIEEMTGFPHFYRIKFDYRYRIGIYCEEDEIEFLRAGTREGFYKKFP